MELLKRLMSLPGVPGREAPIRAGIEDHLRAAALFDEIGTDDFGSLIARRGPRPAGRPQGEGPPRRVLLAAHMDQIGFLVSHVAADGTLRLHPVGAFDPRTLFARPVRIVTEGGEEIAGVLNPPGRPVHTATPEELRNVPALESFHVDTGLSAEAVRARIARGDMVVLDAPFRRVGAYVTGGALDNRVGCWALIRAIERLESHACEIICAWTAQEELGSRAAGPLAFATQPDIGVACDTTVSCAVPGVPEEQHVTTPGQGVALQIADSSMLSDMRLVARIEAVARENAIPCQRALMLGGGQDGALIQRSRAGVPTVVFSCPVKHMHSAAEMVHEDDLAAYPTLLAAWLATL